MLRMSRRHCLLTIAAVLILNFTSTAVSVVQAQDNINGTAKAPGKILDEKHLDGWYYQLWRTSEGDLDLAIELNEHNEGGYGKYKKDNEAFAAALFAKYETVEARLLFTHPLLPDQLPGLVNSLRDQVKSYTLRYKEQKGGAIYLIGFRDLSKPSDEIADNEAIQASMPGVEYGKGVGKINGFVQLILRLNREQYDQLSKLPQVKLVDVAPAYITMQSGVLEEMERGGWTLPYGPIDSSANE